MLDKEYDRRINMPTGNPAPNIGVGSEKTEYYDAEVADVNPYQKWIYAARAVDSWRIFPRIFITTYIILLYKCVMWYMELADPTLEQSGLISIVVGAGAAWFGLYVGTRKGDG